MAQIVKALMLKSVKYKDNDKMLTLFTDDMGKVGAIARGVTKQNAKLKFLAQPFAFCEYSLVKKADRYTITSGTLIESFFEISSDILKTYSAYAVLEMCDKLFLEGVSCTDMLTLSVNTLKEISLGDCLTALISFMLNAFSILGYELVVDNCKKCGQPLTDDVFFSFDEREFYCKDCPNGKMITALTFNDLKKFLGLSFKIVESRDVDIKLLRFLYAYLKYNFEIEINSINELLRLKELENG